MPDLQGLVCTVDRALLVVGDAVTAIVSPASPLPIESVDW